MCPLSTFFAPFISPTQATLITYLRVQAREAKGVAPEVHKVPAEVERSAREEVPMRNIHQGVGHERRAPGLQNAELGLVERGGSI